MAHDGRYDHEAEAIAALTHARASVVIIVGGNRGDGFSVVMVEPDMALLSVLADCLRDVARQMDEAARAQRMQRDN